MLGRFASKWPCWSGLGRDLGCLALLLVPLVSVALPGVMNDRTLAMRDGAHYYYPLWQWVHQQWRSGHVPLWNPHEQGGVSLAADPTACLWYPGHLIFALAGDFRTGYHAFLAIHCALASWGAFRGARHGGASRIGAVIAGLAYGSGAPVLFLYSNPIYLVGAAWLPWSWTAVAQLLKQPSIRFVPGLAIPLSLMVLGGDPQTAYHVGLFALAGVLLYARQDGAEYRPWFQAIDWRATVRRVGGLLAAAILAAILASVQIAPTWMSLDETNRWRDASSSRESPWERPKSDSHDELRYHFSVGPWRWPETAIPNFAGTMFPRHARWMTGVPAEGRVWSPSLYLGTIPVILAMCAMRWRFRRRVLAPDSGGEVGISIVGDHKTDDAKTCWLTETRWLTSVTLFAILAACGWFGVGWLIQEVRHWVAASNETGDALSRLGPQVGGPYWALVKALPGYELFRYPAKWWTVAACGLGLLAARGWDLLHTGAGGRSEMVVRVMAATLIVAGSVGLAMTIAAIVTDWSPRPEALFVVDSWLGPFDRSTAAKSGIVTAMLTIVSGAVLLGLGCRRLRSDVTSSTCLRRVWTMTVVAWIAADLVVANYWLMNWLPADSLAMTPRRTGEEVESEFSRRIYRPVTAAEFPQAWRTVSSERRLVETHAWERSGRYGKLSLLVGESVLSHDDAWGGREWRELLNFGLRHGYRHSDGTWEPSDALLGLLSVDRRTDRRGLPYAKTFPNAWLVDSIDLHDESQIDWHTDADERLNRLLRPGGSWRDFHATAAVEMPSTRAIDARTASDLRRLANTEPSADNVTPPLPCRLRRQGPCEMTIDAATDRPAFLVMNDAWAPGWRAVRTDRANGTSKEIDVLRVNAVMRGVVVPRGVWRIAFRFEPPGLRLGGWLTLIGVMATMTGMGLSAIRRGFRSSP